MYKSCSRCGRVHDTRYKCPKNIPIYGGVDKLRSQRKWTKKSLQIREESQNLCAVCREEGRYNYESLEVHHIIKLKDDPEKLLDDDNLICLCTYHHKLADEGKLDPDYLRELVKKRQVW